MFNKIFAITFLFELKCALKDYSLLFLFFPFLENNKPVQEGKKSFLKGG